MPYAQHQAEQLDARQLILDADFETLAVSDSTMLELARQWTAQVASGSIHRPSTTPPESSTPIGTVSHHLGDPPDVWGSIRIEGVAAC